MKNLYKKAMLNYISNCMDLNMVNDQNENLVKRPVCSKRELVMMVKDLGLENNKKFIFNNKYVAKRVDKLIKKFDGQKIDKFYSLMLNDYVNVKNFYKF